MQTAWMYRGILLLSTLSSGEFSAKFSCLCRYILPSLSLVPNDAEESVRVEFTGVVAQLAATAYRFLQQLQSLHAREMDPSSAGTAPALVRQRFLLCPPCSLNFGSCTHACVQTPSALMSFVTLKPLQAVTLPTTSGLDAAGLNALLHLGASMSCQTLPIKVDSLLQMSAAQFALAF